MHTKQKSKQNYIKKMRIAIFSANYRAENDKLLKKTIDFLEKNGIDVLVESGLHTQMERTDCRFKNYKTVDADNLQADIAISIGGDGTFLNTAAAVGNRGIPILGINNGRLGFLADVADTEIEQVLAEVIAGNYKIRERCIIQANTSDNSGRGLPFALNEIAVLKQDLSSLIAIHASVNGEYLNTYQADGLIIATPTGSTAYSLSVGGPIVMPGTHNLILAPVASHSLTVRPLVIADTCEIDLEIESRSHNYLISLDGRSQPMSQNTKLHITKADFTIKIIEPNGHSFFRTLKNKLMWGMDKRIEK